MRHKLDDRGGPPSLFRLPEACQKAFAMGAIALSIGAAEAALQTGILKEEFFQDALRPQVESGALTSPTRISYAPALEFEETGINFVRRVSGYFIPATTGNYVFFVTSDDDSALFLSTDATPANKRMIAQETGWSGSLSWTTSAGGSNLAQKRSDQFRTPGTTNTPFATGIPLTAGQRYYIEAVHQEGGGGDNLAATFKLVGEPDPEVGFNGAMFGEVIGYDVPAGIVIAGQPQSRRLLPGQTATFSVSFEPPTATVQWFRNGAAIPGAVEATYATPELTAADNNSTYHAVVTEGARTAQSATATITLGQLVPVPNSLYREVWNDYLRQQILDGPLDPPSRVGVLGVFETPTNEADNYAARIAGLFIPPTTGNYVFYIAADDDADLFLSTDATPASKRLIAQETGWSAVRNWQGANGVGGGLSAAQGIAQKHSDTFIPDPVGDPEATPPFAAGISLTAGTPYYIEAVHHEGGGGDNVAVAYRLVGQAPPVNGEAPNITRDVLGTWAAAQTMNGAVINILGGPTNATTLQNRGASFAITANSRYSGDQTAASPGLSYQWQAAPSGSATFTNIPGATGASFNVASAALADQGRQYRVQLFAGDTNVFSPAATLTVTPDTAAPRPVTVTGVNAARNVVTLTFNEALEAASATNAANYNFAPGTIAGSGVTLANGTNVTITTASPLTPNVENTLTITGVRDLAGNAVAANTTIKFTFNPVTYAANILFDGPIGYYRFEEASGSVATNSGTMGSHGAYYIGDEFVPGEGGTPGEAKGEAGPRPPDFVGFAADNRSAAFDGIGDWVDTRQQLLQNRRAFTLEYWVSPLRTNEFLEVWPTRVGLVGQNDAIEYGFIDPDTIQIWTPGGGSLDTDYRAPAAQGGALLPDSEWHHIATIADGTRIQNYFDGVLMNSGGSAVAADYGASTFNVHIGGGGVFDATGNWFRGHMDEVAIFDKAIPADRVLAHYRAGKEGGVLTVSGAVTPTEPGGGDGPNLTTARAGTTLTINWTPAGGTLQGTSTLSNPASWVDIGTANPATVQMTENFRFFRVRR